jgi:DNA modification methylase
MNAMDEENKILKLQKEMERLKKAVKNQRYGLLLMDVPEAFEDDVENKIPILKEIPELAIKNDDGKPTHILIEGDNYHALTCLNYTHKGKIDVIYIDPPYNTGTDGFRYKDKRIIDKFPDGTEIPKDHPFRHSYWLSFMKKRLELARDLLKDTGVMFISIDDNELANLLLLCTEIFKKGDLIDVMVWKKSGFGRDGKMKNTTTFRKDHEYIVVCFKKDKILNKIIEVPGFQNVYNNPDDDPRGPYKAGSISRKEEASNKEHENYYTVISPAGKNFTRQFDIPKDEFERLNSDYVINKNGEEVSRIYWGKNGDAVPAIKIFINETRSITSYSVLLTKGTTTEGTKEVSEILNKDCSDLRPKPTKLIETLIQLATPKDGIVLDFFAGTGTTGHATLKLNEKDGGNRQFIIATNNENEICSGYCYPRIKKCISGYKQTNIEESLLEVPLTWDNLLENFDQIKLKVEEIKTQVKDKYVSFKTFIESNELKVVGINKGKEGKILGLGNSLKYYRTAFIGKNNILNATDEDRVELAHNAGELLAIAENTLELVKQNDYYQLFEDSGKEKYTAVYFREELDKFEDFVEMVEKLKKKTTVYVFSWGNEEFSDDFAYLKDVRVKTIPQPILEIYKNIYNLG